MLKSFVIAGTTAVAIAAGGLAYAQPGPRGDAPRARATAEDVAAFADARLAGLKAGLKLTAEQEKHWPALEAAIREAAKQRSDRMAERFKTREERREARSADKPRERPDAIERLRRGADAMTKRGASLKSLADAAEPLYKSLDDGQKRRFAALMRTGQRAGMGPAHHHGRRGPGYGPGGR